MSDPKDAFITGLDHEDEGDIMDDLVAPINIREKVLKAPELEQVRKDHAKLMGVVRTFGEKVGGMIDKQRYEFMTAYEHHIQDIQNELQALREKVAEISGEETRKAKLETLDKNQTKFKADALTLDTEALSQRKQLRKLVNTLHSVERDRDWVFKRLKSAKKYYNELINQKDVTIQKMRESYEADIDAGGPAGGPPGFPGSEEDASNYYNRTQAYGDDVMSIGSTSTAETSDLSILVGSNNGINKKTKTQIQEDMRKKASAIYGVHREQALLGVLPHIIPVSATAASKNPHSKGQQNIMKQHRRMSQSQSMPALRQGSDSQYAADNTSSPTKAAVRKSREERDAIGELVAMRARQEEIRDFVAQCASACDKGPFAALPKRPISDLLQACRDVLQEMRDNEQQWIQQHNSIADNESRASSYDMMPDPCEEKRLLLAMELSAVPEVYFIISDLLAGIDTVREKHDAARAAAWSAQALSQSRATTEDFPLGSAPPTSTTDMAADRGSNTDDDGGIPINKWSARNPTGDSNIRTDAATQASVGNQDWGTSSDGQQESKGVADYINEFSGNGTYGGDSTDYDNGDGGVKINGWYEDGAPRTATGAQSGDVDLRGFYRSNSSSNKFDNISNDATVDLVGGDDLGSWLANGAASRAAAKHEALNESRRLAGEAVEDDFMRFD
jgi:hypothetical protein